MAAAEPAAKKPRTEEAQADDAAAEAAGEAAGEAKPAVPEPPKAPEPPKELEEDAPKSKLPKVKDVVRFYVQDTTLNVLPSTTSGLLMSLGEGGVQHLLAGARANVGVGAGRYMFEVKVIEQDVPAPSFGKGARNQRAALRLGFSTAASGLFVGDTAESIGFDHTGFLMHNRARTRVWNGGTTHGTVLAVLLNLEDGSPNGGTVSLFKDGQRMCQPQKLPEGLTGKVLYPAVSFKSMTAHVHFGPQPLAPLPFTCHMISDAANSHAMVAKDAAPEGKYEVVLPVGLPDEGTFAWVDQFLAKNPKHVELSGRMILDWAEKSGVSRQGGFKGRSSNDLPDTTFGCPELDDGTIRRALYTIAPLQERNYVVMEVKSNLMEEERKAMLARFPSASFKKVAMVTVGDPPGDFKRKAQAVYLAEKQETLNKSHELQKLEKLRKKELEKAKKQAEKSRKKAEREQKRKLEEARKKLEEDKKKEAEAAAGEEAKDGAEAKKEEEAKTAEKKEEEKKEEDDDEDDDEDEEPAEPEEPVPKAELTDEEKKMTFLPSVTKDLPPSVLGASFAKFALPSKEEGFDQITYEWTKTSSKCHEYLKKWVVAKKMSTPMEDLKPSAWSQQTLQDWSKVATMWRSKQAEFRMRLSSQAQDRDNKKKAALATKHKAEMDAKAAEAKAKAAEGKPEAAQGEGAPADPKEEAAKKVAEAAEAAKEAAEAIEAADAEAEAASAKAAADFDKLDIFGADDVLDVADGAPLFKDFQHEDWALMGLAFELNLLVHAFRRDVEDPDRIGIPVDHLSFYYQKYFHRALRPQDYGVETPKEVVGLIGDGSVYLSDKDILATQLDGEMESPAIFAKLIEEARRYRQIRLDLGQEGAALKFKQPGNNQHNKKKGSGGHWNRGGGGGGNWQQQAPGPQQQAPMQMQQQAGAWNAGYGKAQQKGSGKWSSGPYHGGPTVGGGKVGMNMGGKGGKGDRWSKGGGGRW